MQEKLAFSGVSGPADIANVGFLPGVRAAVLVQVPLLTERFTTEITCKRPGQKKMLVILLKGCLTKTILYILGYLR